MGSEKNTPKQSPLAKAYPHVAELMRNGGWVELGYEPNTDTFARAIIAESFMCGCGDADMTIEELLEELNKKIVEWNES